MTRPLLLAGCDPEVAVGAGGRILAVGAGARDAAGPDATVRRLRGRALPGLGDAHLHLEWLARDRGGVDLAGARTRRDALQRVATAAAAAPTDGWVTGAGWFNDAWTDDPRPLHRAELDAAGGGRAVLLIRKDGHSAALSSAALRAAGYDASTPDPAGGVIDRDHDGEPAGMVREAASNAAQRMVPPLTDAQLDASLESVLHGLARAGLCAVHTMDSARLFTSLQRLHRAGRLPVRVAWNLPVDVLGDAETVGLASGFGDEWLRVWGVKAFLDGSLGSDTAEMLDGSGVVVMPQEQVIDVVVRSARAGLNVCLHAIGDAAVRRALDALDNRSVRDALTVRAAGSAPWRPRIEHAQCVHPDDVTRFAALGVIASMQPLHAVSDRDIADAKWGDRVRGAYAWGALHAAGTALAFGSDAPVEDASPLRGLDAATGWRTRARWHPELALDPATALHAYTRGVAYAAGMEHVTGSLEPGLAADVTVVDADDVVATVVGGTIAWGRES